MRLKLLMFLPDQWVALVKDGGIHVGMCARSLAWVIQRSIFVSPDGKILVSVHGQELPPGHEFWKDIQTMEPVKLTSDTVNEFADTIIKTVNLLRRFEICPGVQKYQPAWKYAENCFVDRNAFRETRYQTTCRSESCAMLISGFLKRRCAECSSLCRVVERRFKGLSCKTPPKHKPFKDLKTPEKMKRQAQTAKELRRIRKQNQRLRDRIDGLLRKDGVFIQDEVVEDMNSILNSETAQAKLTPLQKIFIEQQVKAASRKDRRGMRWHPAMIRLALSIQYTSPAAYDELTGLLNLPSKRQLFNYSHIMDANGKYARIFRRLPHFSAMKTLWFDRHEMN